MTTKDDITVDLGENNMEDNMNDTIDVNSFKAVANV